LQQLVVTSCGLSLLSNSARQSGIDPFPWQMANMREQDLTLTTWQLADSIADAARSCLAGADANGLKRLSAELNVLLRLYNHDLGAARGDMHYLLSSDTYLGRFATALLEEWLRGHDLVVNTVLLRGLTMGNAFDPKFGIDHLIRWVSDIIPGYRDRGYRVVFNVVGGFKVIQAYLNILGMLYCCTLTSSFTSFRQGRNSFAFPDYPSSSNQKG